MPVHEIVDMVSVRYLLVTTVGSVNVAGFVCAAIVFRRAPVGVFRSSRDLVVVHMVVVRVVQMPIVKIVGMAIVLHSGVAASCSVDVLMVLVFGTVVGHDCLQFGLSRIWIRNCSDHALKCLRSQ